MLRHELVRTDEIVKRRRCVMGPDVDDLDVDHAGKQSVKRCREGLRRQASESRWRRGGVVQFTWEGAAGT